MALISLLNRSHVKKSMVLMRADNLFINNYIRSLLSTSLQYYCKTYFIGANVLESALYYFCIYYIFMASDDFQFS